MFTLHSFDFVFLFAKSTMIVYARRIVHTLKMALRSLVPKYWQIVISDVLYSFRINRKLAKNLDALISSTILNKDSNNFLKNFSNVLQNYEFSIYSQNGEDGILLYLFSKIGFSTRKCIEIGIGDGRENNSANLIFHHSFGGLLIDGNPQYVEMAKYFFDRQQTSKLDILACFVTAENVSTLLNNFSGQEIDLLSIDVDGNDYWIWEAITETNPRVVVVEYNSVFGPEQSITVPYDPLFNCGEKHPSYLYAGASLTALVVLGKKKGYSFVGCESSGINAFFVRDDLINESIRIANSESSYFFSNVSGFSNWKDAFEIVRDMPYCSI